MNVLCKLWLHRWVCCGENLREFWFDRQSVRHVWTSKINWFDLRFDDSDSARGAISFYSRKRWTFVMYPKTKEDLSAILRSLNP